MATGAGDQYWEQQRLPSVFKHDLLRRYLPVFTGKTGSRAGGVVYLDGYAGRGRYEDGTPASAELILQVAENQSKLGIGYQLFFYESDADSYNILRGVVGEYLARGIDAKAERADVIGGLDGVITAASRLPLFLFLDPCGLGISFGVLARTLSGPRSAVWPPTEILLNFSMDAVRRISGHVRSLTPNERIMARLDEALGGGWWRDHVRSGVTDDAMSAVVEGFRERLGQATQMKVLTIPVLREPGQRPVYYLVFGTRNPLGIWHFADSAARATQAWWAGLTVREDAKMTASGQDPLFDELIIRGPKLEDVEAQAVAEIAENIASLASANGRFRVGDYPAEVFGLYLGRVRESVVRAAIKQLHASGRTASNGVGGRVANLVVSPLL